MLNKELLLTTEDQPAEPIKLKVGYVNGVIGHSRVYGNQGSVSRRPIWNLTGHPVVMDGLASFSYDKSTALMFEDWSKVDADSITVTVVEKGLTITLRWNDSSYETNTQVFKELDVGKTFTIVFDPEPTGYV